MGALSGAANDDTAAVPTKRSTININTHKCRNVAIGLIVELRNIRMMHWNRGNICQSWRVVVLNVENAITCNKFCRGVEPPNQALLIDSTTPNSEKITPK